MSSLSEDDILHVCMESINIHQFGVQDPKSKFRVNATIGTIEIPDITYQPEALLISGSHNDFESDTFQFYSASDALQEFNRNADIKKDCCAIIFVCNPSTDGKCVCYFVRNKKKKKTTEEQTKEKEIPIEYRRKIGTWALILINDGLPYCMSNMCNVSNKSWGDNLSLCTRLAGLYCGMTTKYLNSRWCDQVLKEGKSPVTDDMLTVYCQQVLTPTQAIEDSRCSCYLQRHVYDTYFDDLIKIYGEALGSQINKDKYCTYGPCFASEYRPSIATNKCPSQEISVEKVRIRADGHIDLATIDQSIINKNKNKNRSVVTKKREPNNVDRLVYRFQFSFLVFILFVVIITSFVL